MHRILYSACHQNGAYMSFVVRDKASGKFIAYTLRCDSTVCELGVAPTCFLFTSATHCTLQEVSADLNETLGKAFELAYKQREDHLAAVSLDACEGVGRFLLSVRLAPLMCTIKGGSAAQLGSVRFELTSRSSGLVGGRSGVVDPNKAMEAIEAGFNEKCAAGPAT